MKILTIGSAMRDIFLQYQYEEMLRLHTATKTRSFIILEEGKKIEVNNIAYHTGGGATNSAVSFKRLGFDVASFFKIGTDHEGDFVLEKLATENVSTHNIARTSSIGTGTSFITPCLSGDRTVLVYRGANLTLTEAELPGDAISACDHLYITSLSGETSRLLPIITKQAKQQNKLVATNPGTSQLTANVHTLKESLPFIDTLILNYYEATLLMKAFTQPIKQKIPQLDGKSALPRLLQTIPITFSYFHLLTFFQEILKQDTKIVAVTNGADGVYIAHKNRIYYHPSIKPKNLVSTLGAGDAFGSCFVAQLAQNKSIEDAIRSGILNSSSALEHLDAKTGLLNKRELEKRLKQINTDLLQRFSY